MSLDFSQFYNIYDISFLTICITSIFFGMRNGLIKSSLNLIKWIIIFYLIKNSFNFLREIVDLYISNQTVSDVFIFIFTLIISYILLSTFNRILIGVIQPKGSSIINISFGAMLGIFRGYIIFVLLIFFINSNFQVRIFSEFLNEGSFKQIVDYGINFLDHVPRNLKKIDGLGV